MDFPFQVAKKSNYLGRGDFKSLTDYYDQLTGGKGIPKDSLENIAYSTTMGLPFGAAEAVGEGLAGLNAPEWAQTTGEIATLILAHKFRVPEFKALAKDAEKVAAKTGQSAEQVLQKAAQESGVSMEKIAAGDKEAISSLKSKITEAPKVAEKVKGTPKEVFNQKAAERQREAFGSKLPESPLSEYYEGKTRDIEKEASKKPETVAREKEIRDRLAPEESKLINEVRSQKEELKRIEGALKRSTGEGSGRIQVLKEYQVKKFNDTLEKLKDVQYEMKYGRARPSEAEIDAQIQKSIKEYQEGIESPSEKTEKAVARQLELDKQYLDSAKKLIDRGEIPGEIRPDTFIKMKQKYLEGYNAAIKQARERISELKGETDMASKRKMEVDKELIKRLNDRVARLKADVVNQTDKLKAMRALEKPSGAFYKQQLKSLQKDGALFKHDLFKHAKVRTAEELKTARVTKGKFGEGKPAEIEAGRKVVENPTPENIKEAAEQTGKKESELTKSLNEMKKEVKGLDEKVKAGTVTPKTETVFYKWARRLAIGMPTGFAIGALQATIERFTDYKPDASILNAILKPSSGIGTAPTGPGYKFVRNLYDKMQAEELIKRRGDFKAWNDYINNMRTKYGQKKVNRVLKKAQELESNQQR